MVTRIFSDSIFRLSLTIIVSLLFAELILINNKASYGISIILLFAIGFIILVMKNGYEKSNKLLLYSIVFTIPFPFFIQVLGRDAVTITTILIYIQFLLLILNGFVNKKSPFKVESETVIAMLLILSFTMSLILNPYLIGQSFKYYLANVSGILLYLIIRSSVNKYSTMLTVFKIIIVVLVIQSFVAFLELQAPGIHKYLSIFSSRNVAPSLAVVDGVPRARGTVGDYELLAEMFLVGCMLAVALFYMCKRYYYIAPLFCCFAGIIFTKTRSGLILFALGMILCAIIMNISRKDYKSSSLKLLFIFIIGGIMLVSIFPQQIKQFASRFNPFFQSAHLLSAEAINREAVWKVAVSDFLNSPSLFGKGFYYVTLTSGEVRGQEFHSLYLTLLYKIGIIGFAIYCLFWIVLLFKGWKRMLSNICIKYWYAVLFMFLSVALLLINEIKIEYLRYVHTIQFAWLIYGLMSASLNLEGKVIENENIIHK